MARLSAALRPHVLGLSLCGAGGGGFMKILTKQPVAAAADTVAKVRVSRSLVPFCSFLALFE